MYSYEATDDWVWNNQGKRERRAGIFIYGAAGRTQPLAEAYDIAEAERIVSALNRRLEAAVAA